MQGDPRPRRRVGTSGWNQFANRDSKWIWYPDCLDQRRPDLPLLVSEFGNWGLPNPEQLNEKDAEPWWFQTGHEWGDGIVHPHAMRHRFDYFGLQEVFGSFEQFIADSQEHMARSLHYEISSMRLRPEIGGYVITELTDVHWECNGLLSHPARGQAERLDPILTSVNQDNVVIVRPQQWSGLPGEAVRVEFHAFGVDGPAHDGMIEWCVATAKTAAGARWASLRRCCRLRAWFPYAARWLYGGALVANQAEIACVQPPVAATPAPRARRPQPGRHAAPPWL